MLGELNSTIIFFAPEEGSSGFLRPRFLLKPYASLDFRTMGRTSEVSVSGLKKKPMDVFVTIGFLTSGVSGKASASSCAKAFMSFFFWRSAGTASCRSPCSGLAVNASVGYIICLSTPDTDESSSVM